MRANTWMITGVAFATLATGCSFQGRLIGAMEEGGESDSGEGGDGDDDTTSDGESMDLGDGNGDGDGDGECPDDGNEPNDTFDTATDYLDLDDPSSGSLCSDDVDVWRISVPHKPVTLEAWFLGTPDVELRMIIHGPDEATKLWDHQSTSGGVNAPIVTATERGDYFVTLIPLSPQTGATPYNFYGSVDVPAIAEKVCDGVEDGTQCSFVHDDVEYQGICGSEWPYYLCIVE